MKKKITMFFLLCYTNIYCAINEDIIDTLEQFRGIFLDVPLSVLKKIMGANIFDFVNISSSTLSILSGNFVGLGALLLLLFTIINFIEFGFDESPNGYKLVVNIYKILYKFFYLSIFIFNSSFFLYLMYGFISPLMREIMKLLETDIKMKSLSSVINSDINIAYQILLAIHIYSIYAIFTVCLITIIVRILKEKIYIFWLELLAPVYISFFSSKKYSDFGKEYVLSYISAYLNMCKEILYLIFIVHISDIISVFIKKIWNLPNTEFSILVPTVATVLGALITFFGSSVTFKAKNGLMDLLNKNVEVDKESERKKSELKNESLKTNIYNNLSLLKGQGSLKEKLLNDFINVNYVDINKNFLIKFMEKRLEKSKINRKINNLKSGVKNTKEVLNANHERIKNTVEVIKEIKNNNTGTLSFLKASNVIIKEKLLKLKEERKKDILSSVKIEDTKNLLKQLAKKRLYIHNYSSKINESKIKIAEKDLNNEINSMKKYIKMSKKIEGKLKDLKSEYDLNNKALKILKEKDVTNVSINYETGKIHSFRTYKDDSSVKANVEKSTTNDEKIKNNHIKNEKKSDNKTKDFLNEIKNEGKQEKNLNTKINRKVYKVDREKNMYRINRDIRASKEKQIKNIYSKQNNYRVEMNRLQETDRKIKEKIENKKTIIEKKKSVLEDKKKIGRALNDFRGVLDNESKLINNTNDFLSDIGKGESLVLIDNNNSLLGG